MYINDKKYKLNISIASQSDHFKSLIEGTDCYLPEGITHLADSKCISCPTENLIMPNSIEYIGDYCFYYGRMKTIQFSPNLKHIGNNCFQRCSSLETIVLPDSVEYIGDMCFYIAETIQNIQFPKSLTHLGENLTNSSKLTFVDLSMCEKLLELNGCFNLCQRLNSIILPPNIQKIGDNLLSNYCPMSDIYIPSSIETISEKAFQNCKSLTTITIDKPTNSVRGAPWGATNATVIWNDSLPLQEVDLTDYEYTMKGNDALITKYIGNGGDIVWPTTEVK